MQFFKRLLLASLLLAVTGLFTQSSDPFVINIRQLSVEDGMASREVFCGLQDKKGFIWFGTRSGLNRYDGKNFLLYSENNSGLRDDRIIRIAEDDSGFIWIMHGDLDRYNATDTRIDVLNTFSGVIAPLTNAIPKVPFYESQVISFARNSKGEFKIHLRNGQIYVWSREKGFVKQDLPWKMNSQNCTHLMNGQADLLVNYPYTFIPGANNPAGGDSAIIMPLMIGKEGVIPSLIYNMNSLEFALVDLTGRGDVLGSSSLISSCELPLKGTINALSVLYDAMHNSSIVHVTNQSLAYCSEGVYYPLMNKFEMATHPAFTPYSFFSDCEGNSWLCTNTGVYIIHSERNRFRHYFTSDEVSVSYFEGTQARAIYAVGDTIYANIWDHLLIRTNEGVEDYSLGRIGYPLFVNNHTVWTGGNAIMRFDLRTKSETQFATPNATNLAWSIFPLNDSTLVYGFQNGIYLFNIRTQELTEFENPWSLPVPHHVYKIIRDQSGRLLAAAEEGIYELSESGELSSYYGPETTKPEHQFFFRDIYDICQDKNGNYWMATNGKGIFRWDGETDVQHYTKADGLSSDLVYCILEDDNGFLWLSSDYGLMRFDPKTINVTTFTTLDGLTHNEFNRISAFKSEDGQMYFGGLNGIIAFDPNDFVNDTVKFDAPLQVVSYSQFSNDNNQLMDMDTALNTEGKIILQPGDKFFTLEFVLLDFKESQHHYAYMIDGIDADWIYTSENSIRFSDLPYGEYTLRIKGQNAEGEWSTSQLTIPVVVLKPFYRANWFIGVVIILAGLMFFGIVRWRTFKLRKEKIKLEELVQERTEELSQSLEEKEILLREIHHRVKNNLQIISGLLELQSASIDDERTRAILADSQNRVQSIGLIHHRLYQNENLSSIEFSGFVTELFRQVSGVYKSNTKQTIAEIEIKKTYLDIDTAIPAGLIINELLVNSFKYAFAETAEGKVRIELLPKVKDQFELHYSDNGPGIPKHVDIIKSKSLGLRLVMRLSKQIGGVVEYVPGSQHRFIITFTSKRIIKNN